MGIVNIAALRAFAVRLRGFQEFHPPDAPGATIVMAKPEPNSGYHATFSGCDIDPEAAFARCVGEAVEWTAQNARSKTLPPADPALPSIEMFDGLFAGTSGPTAFVEGRALPSGARVRLPLDLCARGAALRTSLSSGCAAGADTNGALLGALCELIERDAAMRWWDGESPARRPAQSVQEAFSSYLRAARAGVSRRRSFLLDIGARAVAPVMAAVSFDGNGEHAVFGFKAAPNPVEAATGALRELLQMETGLALAMFKAGRAGRGDLSMAERAQLTRAQSIGPDFPPLNACEPAPEDHDQVCADASQLAHLLGRAGHEVFAVALGEYADLPVARALAGGLRSPAAQPAGEGPPGPY